MALQTSGAISLNDIHVEAGGTSGTTASLNDADIRDLIGKASGAQMSFSEWYGASAAPPYIFSSPAVTGASYLGDASVTKTLSTNTVYLNSWCTAGYDNGTVWDPAYGDYYFRPNDTASNKAAWAMSNPNMRNASYFYRSTPDFYWGAMADTNWDPNSADSVGLEAHYQPTPYSINRSRVGGSANGYDFGGVAPGPPAYDVTITAQGVTSGAVRVFNMTQSQINNADITVYNSTIRWQLILPSGSFKNRTNGWSGSGTFTSGENVTWQLVVNS